MSCFGDHRACNLYSYVFRTKNQRGTQGVVNVVAEGRVLNSLCGTTAVTYSAGVLGYILILIVA